jgi:hypothetical protein
MQMKESGIRILNRSLDSSNRDSAHFRLAWLRNTILLALAGCMVLSWKLWISTRFFPLTPVSDSLPAIHFPFDYLWFFFLLALLALVFFLPRAILLFVFVCLAIALSLWDQTRWQPWFVQTIAMLAVLGWFGWKKRQHQEIALDLCRLIIVASYFWSGWQKLNVNFVRQTWPEIISFLPQAFQFLGSDVPASIIPVIPLVEIAISFGLLTRRFRNLAVIFAIITHLFILSLLVLSGENTVVWPWNLAMAAFVFVLFWGELESDTRKIIFPKNIFHLLILIFFGALPALSFAGRWDSYLSSALYSGNTRQAVIYMRRPVIERLPGAIHEYIWQSTEPFFLDINRWSFGELNVSVYPENRVYRKVAQWVCRQADNDSVIQLRILGKPDPFTGLRKSEYYDCEQLR